MMTSLELIKAIEVAERRGFVEAKAKRDFGAWDYLNELKMQMGWSEEDTHPEEKPLTEAFERGHRLARITQSAGLPLWAWLIIGIFFGLMLRLLLLG